MRKVITIGILSAFSLAAHGCSVAVSPPPQSNQPAPPLIQTAQPNDNAQTRQNESDRRTSNPETTSVAATKSVSSPEKSTDNLSSTASLAQPAQSNVTGTRQDRSWETQGTASTGETVTLSFDSIQVATRSLGLTQSPTYFFQYKIGSDHVYAVTACNGEFSTSLDGDRYDVLRRPESEATQKMLNRVCSAWVRPAQVLSPPSHVRMGPKDEIICTLQTSQSITTYGHYEDWVYTNACGKLGLIHSSQIR
jgi:hypothetical protein